MTEAHQKSYSEYQLLCKVQKNPWEINNESKLVFSNKLVPVPVVWYWLFMRGWFLYRWV